MRKKAQIQMMETITVLLVFFIIVFLGLVFYSKIMRSKVSEEADKIEELSQIEIAQLASSLPELQCSQDNILRSNCIDLLKLEAASNGGVIQGNPNTYFNIFAFSNITVKTIFPSSTEEWQLYTKEPNVIGSKLPTFFPISLYDPKEKEYRFGLMIVEVYI